MTKMAHSWESVRDEALERGLVDEAGIAAAERRERDAQRAYRLAQLRERVARTQVDVAEQMHVSQARVSKIEHGDLERTELGTLAAYLEALGGELRIVAELGDGDTITLR